MTIFLIGCAITLGVFWILIRFLMWLGECAEMLDECEKDRW